MITRDDLLEFLPRTDCGQCGLSCSEFAGLVLGRQLNPEDCPVLHEPDYTGFIEALHELLAQAGPAPAPAMHIDPEKCNGCGICVAMCEYHLGNVAEARMGRGPRPTDRVVFWIVNGVAAVRHQELCTRAVQAAERCNKCADHCPTEAITLF